CSCSKRSRSSRHIAMSIALSLPELARVMRATRPLLSKSRFPGMRSIQLGARILHHFGPAPCFAADEFAERIAVEVRRLGAQAVPDALLLGRRKRLGHLGLHLLDDVPGRALGRPQAVPGGHLV